MEFVDKGISWVGFPLIVYSDQYPVRCQQCKISLFSHSFEVCKFPLAVKHIF